jgi:hypothetical protein
VQILTPIISQKKGGNIILLTMLQQFIELNQCQLVACGIETMDNRYVTYRCADGIHQITAVYQTVYRGTTVKPKEILKLFERHKAEIVQLKISIIK